MNTPWNFNYAKIYTPEKFNIRPSYTIPNLYIDNNSNILRGFSLLQLQNLVDGMIISLPSNIEFGSTRTIISIDILSRSLIFSGSPMTIGVSSDTFYFNSEPGYFSEQPSPLTGQQLHDNFFYLAEGLTNHQERMIILEAYKRISGDTGIGFVTYNGLESGEGYFYGGDSLYLNASVNFDTLKTFDINSPYSFTIAMNNGIASVLEDSTFYEIIFGDDLPLGTTFATSQLFCNYANEKLINNRITQGFSFSSTVSMAPLNITGDYATLNWDTEIDASFYIKIDDADETDIITIKLEESDRPTTVTSLVNTLNNKFIEQSLNTKIYAEEIDNGGGDIRLYITGINTRTGINPGCTRIEIMNITAGTFIENVLHMVESSIYDFSTTLSFIVNPSDTNKISLIGLNPSFKVVLKDGETFPALYNIGYNSGQFSGSFISYHVTPPSNDTTLNYDGNFRATKGIFNSLEIGNATFNVISSVQINNSGALSTNSIFSDTLSIVTSGIIYDLTISNDLEVTNNTILNTATINGDFNVKSNLLITNTDHTTPHTFYKLPILETISPYNLISANAPEIELGDNDYLLYNGSFGAYNIDAVGTLRVHGEVTGSVPGRLYSGTGVVPSSTIYTLNYDGNFRATSVTPSSSRITKTNIKPTTLNALDLLMKTLIVDYNFKTDLNTPKIGFIAEDTDTLLSTPEQNGMDLANGLGVVIKAIQELYMILQKE